MKDRINSLREILLWHLSRHTVPELISDAYSNIEMEKVKEMLGNPGDLNGIIQATGFLNSAAADA